MKLVVGLGNPGQKYLRTRHNIGFLIIDELARQFSAPPFKKEKKAEVSKIIVNNQPALLCKPQTFMNLSGTSVQPLMSFYDIALEDLIVIHDDIDQAFGGIKLQKTRGHGGHNGIRDIHHRLNTNEYVRIKIGVGRSSNPNIDVADHVLQNFSAEEEKELSNIIDLSSRAVEEFVRSDWETAANKHNKKGN